MTEKPSPAISDVGVLIPVFRPKEEMAGFVLALIDSGLSRVVIVDDGSDPQHLDLLQRLKEIPSVTVLRHLVHLGRGAAIRTGINYFGVEQPSCRGIVLVDTDRECPMEDVLKVARTFLDHPNSLVLGVYADGKGRTLKSKLQRRAVRSAYRFMVRRRIGDHPTGLRGIPSRFFPFLLTLSSNGYEYEMDMLVELSLRGVSFVEVPISFTDKRIDQKAGFRPVVDSLRNVFVFLRFILASLTTAGIDLAVFSFSYYLSRNILLSVFLARIVAGVFNYTVCRTLVFRSRKSIVKSLVEYAFLVSTMAMISYSVLTAAVIVLGANVYFAKILIEAILFAANFAIQQSVIFSRPERVATGEEKTDWARYYEETHLTSMMTRSITTARLLEYLRLSGENTSECSIVEIGGGNSSFYETINARILPSAYIIIDNSLVGLTKFQERFPDPVGRGEVRLHHCDVLQLEPETRAKADVCFSVGVIEHFSPEEMRKAIDAHFDLVKDNGLVVISFPTPTWLYLLTRKIAERMGRWHFPDERPLRGAEVREVMAKHGVILKEEIIWPIFLTQCIIAARKSAE
jgi:cyclopropane fatty-acyl-phospholipid synthase-like methyltransferase/glycosyltransferase involved in cell wall biosynthesis